MYKLLIPQYYRAFTQSLCVLTCFFAITACDSKGRSDDDDDNIGPAGREVTAVDLSLYDAKPDISSDGTKVIFISGRDNALKVYRYDQADPETGAAKLHEEELGEEVEATIAPNGSAVAFVASGSDGYKIYVSGFDGTELTEVETEGTGVVTALVFSPDSAYLAFIRRDSSDNRRKLTVVSVAGDLTLGEPEQLSGDDDDESQPVWLSTGTAGSYQLVTRQREAGTFTESMLSRTFTTGVADVARSTLVDGLPVTNGVTNAGTSTGIFYSLPNPQGSGRRKPIEPAGEDDTEKLLSVINIPYFLAKTGGDSEKLSSPGTEVASISASTDNTLGVWLVREAYACLNSKNDLKINYGTTMLLHDIAGEEFTRFIPRPETKPKKASEVESWEIVDDVCDMKINEKDLVDLDTLVLSAKVAPGSTLTSYSVIYTSLYSADLEVRLVTVSGDETTFYDVSNNVKK